MTSPATPSHHTKTTIGLVKCQNGVILGADRRWSISGPNQIPYLTGQCLKIKTFMHDSTGQPMIVVATTGSLSFMESGLPKIFNYYYPTYLERMGIDLESLRTPDAVHYALKGFTEYLTQSGLWSRIYRPGEEMTGHLLVFRNPHIVCAYQVYAFHMILPLEEIRTFKRIGDTYSVQGQWLAMGSGQVHFKSAMASLDRIRPLYQQTFAEAAKSMSVGLYAATMADPYSHPGLRTQAKSLSEVAQKIRQDGVGKVCDQVDLCMISTESVQYQAHSI